MKKLSIGKILVIVTAVLMIGTLCTIFAPALSFTYISRATEEVAGTGTVSSLFTIIFGLKSKYTFNGEVSYTSIEIKKNILGLIFVLIMVALVVLAISMVVLAIKGNFKGKKKIILSTIFAVFLLSTIVFSLLLPTLIKVTPLPDELEEVYAPREMRKLDLAPILYASIGGVTFISNIINLYLNRD